MSGPPATRVAERRAEYVRLRQHGAGPLDAATRVGIRDPAAVANYEHWFEAYLDGFPALTGNRATRETP